MIIEICGIEEINYTSKKTGKDIHGQKVYFTFPDKDIRGVGCDTAFVTEEKKLNPNMSLPVDAELYYNKYGRIENILVV